MRIVEITSILSSIFFVGMALVLSGCGAVTVEDVPATMLAENQSFLTEAADIRSTLSVRETQVLATSIAAETLVAQENLVNAVLLATVRAGDPPTVQVVAQFDRSGAVAGGTPNPEQFSDVAAGTPIETYVTSEIRQSDGCGVDQQRSFPTGTTILYAVQRVQDIPANTLINIDWFYNGAVAFSDSLVVNTYEDDLCIWFFLEPYSQGAWSVQFYSNGNAIGTRVDFTVGG